MTARKREGSLVPLGTEIALAFTVALMSFVIVAITFDALEATALVIAAVVVCPGTTECEPAGARGRLAASALCLPLTSGSAPSR